MHILQYLTRILVVATAGPVSASTPAFADLDTHSPDLGRDEVAFIEIAGVAQENIHLLVARQLDLDNIADSITGLLQPLLQLISSKSLANINTIITQAASLLGDGGAEDVKSLVNVIAGVLDSDTVQDLIDQLEPLLPV
jgi:hypothetical protein